MVIAAWKHDTAPTYLVQVGDDMYEMDERANMPNGVCIYIGPTWRHTGECAIAEYLADVPIGIARQIAYLANR